MFSEKYTVKIIVDNTLLFVKDYTTYQAILDDFPVFETTENVRTCKRMLEKNIKPKYKKITKISTHPGSQENPGRQENSTKRSRHDFNYLTILTRLSYVHT